MVNAASSIILRGSTLPFAGGNSPVRWQSQAVLQTCSRPQCALEASHSTHLRRVPCHHKPRLTATALPLPFLPINQCCGSKLCYQCCVSKLCHQCCVSMLCNQCCGFHENQVVLPPLLSGSGQGGAGGGHVIAATLLQYSIFNGFPPLPSGYWAKRGCRRHSRLSILVL